MDEAPSLHLFDLATEAEIPISIPLGEDSIHGLFPAGAGFEILLGDLAPSRLLRVDHDGRVLATASLRLEHGPRIRLPDGRFVSYGRALDAPRPGPARLEVAVPDGPTTSIDLGFLIEEDHLGDIEWTGELIVGVAYQLATSTILRFEVDLTSGIVDVRELMTGVIPGGSGPGSRDVMVWADAERVTAGIVYEPDGSPGAEVAELVWWPIGGSDVVRRVVRPLDTLGVDIIAFDGSPPRQTLALAQTSGSRAWISAARVEGPGAVIGGVEPLTIVSFYRAAAAWEPAPGSAALALMSARELEVIYLCEGVP